MYTAANKQIKFVRKKNGLGPTLRFGHLLKHQALKEIYESYESHNVSGLIHINV